MRSPEIRALVERSEARSPATRLVLTFLLLHSNGHDDCWPSTRTLARETRLNRTTVLRSIGELVESGDVEAEPVPGRLTRYSFAARRSDLSTGRRSDPSTGVVGSVNRNRSDPSTKTTKNDTRTNRARANRNGRADDRPASGSSARSEPITDDRGTFLPGTGWVGAHGECSTVHPPIVDRVARCDDCGAWVGAT